MDSAEDVKTGEASMAAYSLSAHRIVHRFDLPTSPYAFLANSAFIAIVSLPWLPMFSVPTSYPEYNDTHLASHLLSY
jgi:hypothetical protein